MEETRIPRKSARIIGQECNIGNDPRVTNMVFCYRGILSGTPGNYSLTDMGKNYGVEKWVNRNTYKMITYDDSIKEVLSDTPSDLIEKAQQVVRGMDEAKKAKREARIASSIIPAASVSAPEKKQVFDLSNSCKSFFVKNRKTIIYSGIAFLVVGTGCGIYKIYSHCKKKKEEILMETNKEDIEENRDVVE